MIVIPFTRLVRTTNLRVSQGTVLFDEATKVKTFLLLIIIIII
jgi:hypothetical protein